MSVVCSAITHRPESRRTRNHILLSHLRLPQPGGPVALIYIPQEQGGPVVLPGIGLFVLLSSSSSYIAADGQLASLSWCQTPGVAHYQILIFFV
jgi:hypothetical protein